MTLPKLLIATNNPGKVRELKSLLGRIGVTLLIPADLELNLYVEEDGLTYAENATRKASAFARASGIISLADDSGLEVDVLNGEPGLHSARYASIPNATDADRRGYLLQRLHEKPRPWMAHFRATVAVATPDGNVQLATGRCDGEIIPEERGRYGFGYDPIFLVRGSKKTMAELAMEEKNHLSHRARAVQNALPIIKKILDIG